ncbi:MAG: hypothetical protein K2O32_05580 [Acetatifactor sp.]|nr:hypothetical protein [Acetatifactor sp.]
MKRAFYGVFSISLIAILITVIFKPQNNLIPARMFLYMLVWVLILCGIRWGIWMLEKFLKDRRVDLGKLSRRGLILYVVVYGISLYVVSLILRSYPVTDYGSVYETAYQLAMGQTVDDWNYFSMWTNNLSPLTILTFCMKLGVFLGFSDPYYFVLAINVLQVTLVLVCIFYLMGKIGLGGAVTQWFAVFVYTLWTPIWACTNAFYSDQLSFGGSIIAVALLVYGCGVQSRRKWGAIIGAGLIWGVAIAAKATSAIALVALIVTLILVNSARRWKELLTLGVVMVLTVGSLSAISNSYPSKAEEYRLKFPTEYWIALGLMEDGTYGANADFIKECYLSKNVDERRELCLQKIRENWKNLFQGEHLVDKVSVIFGDGSISPTSHIYPYQESLLWHWVYWEGDYFWKYACLSTGFFYAVLLLMIVGAVLRTFGHGSSLEVKSGEFCLTFMIYLTVFGTFLFLMLWETQNKQLYNQIPWMTLAAVCGLESVWDYVIMRVSKGRFAHVGQGSTTVE